MKKLLTLAALGAAFSAASYAAVITPYTTAASFNASTIVGGSATVTENFNTNTSVFTTFTIVGGSVGGATRGISNQMFNDQTDDSPLQTTTISLNNLANLVAAGADWDLTPGGAGRNVVLTLNFGGGVTQTLTQVLGGNTGNYSAPFFFGFTSDTPFVSFTLGSGAGAGNETFTFDNLLLEQEGGSPPPPPPPATPEPATFGLMGVAMVGLGLARRLRK